MSATERRGAERVPPSRLRAPLAIVLGVIMLPLGLLVWIALSGSHRVDYLRSPWIRAGFGICFGSAVPLLIVAVASSIGVWPDPHPNPLGLGLLLVAGSTVGSVLVAVGVAVVSRAER